LDRSYQPVGKISWQRAVTLFFQGKVEVVEEYEDREVRAVTFAIKMPSVVRFLRMLRSRRKAIKFSRENVYTRDQGRCQYCSNKVPRHEATYDHVVPRAQGGRTNWENIVIACIPCNQHKGGRRPEQAKMKLLSVPVKPKKLPDMLHLTFIWRKGMPDSWRNWLRDITYWHGELDSE
jgi:5-methylcytosine-specific restriction endonuclease McrA